MSRLGTTSAQGNNHLQPCALHGKSTKSMFNLTTLLWVNQPKLLEKHKNLDLFLGAVRSLLSP